MKNVTRWILALMATVVVAGAAETGGRVRSLKITILSTMLADGNELGEWGFAALVEVDGARILFDTGAKTDVVLKNTQTLKIDLGDVTDVILSHWHDDHVGGFLTLRRALVAKTPGALSRAHVGDGIFASRVGVPPNVEQNAMIRIKPDYEATGGKFVVYRQPTEIRPGVWLTGPVPRKFPERNWSGSLQMRTADGRLVDETVVDDMALVINTEQGLVIVTGCGHAGVINITDYARSFVRPAPLYALIGGIHLFNATDETVGWTIGKLREFGLQHFIGAHCTGVETVYRFRAGLPLDRAHGVVGAVGQTFELGRGIDPRRIAR